MAFTLIDLAGGAGGPGEININIALQSKTVDSSTAEQTVLPTDGYIGLKDVTVNPYVLDSSSLVITENGEYVVTSAEDGLSRVDVSVNIDTSSYYDSGYSDGQAAQKALLDTSTFTENGTYTRENGWNEVTVLVEGTVNNQDKTVDSSTVSQSVQADSGYTGLGTVTINPYTLDSKTVNSSTGTQVITSDADGLSQVTINPYVLSSLEVDSSTASQEYTGQYGTVTITPYVLDAKTVYPSTSEQVVTSDEDGLASVTIEPVTSSIDANIQAGNIKDGVTILGVQGTYVGTVINNQSKSVDSSTALQTVTYDSGYTGLGTVTVTAYDIDSCYILAASI